MSDTTSEGGGQFATPLSKDDETITISKSVHDKHMRNAFIVGNLSRTYDTPVDKLIPFFAAYGIQERIDELEKHRRADAPDDKPEYTAGIALPHRKVEERIAELTALKDKQSKED